MRRGLAALFFVVAAGALALGQSTAMMGCGGCDFESECADKNGRSDSDRGLLCDYLGLELTLNTTSVFWGKNPGDPPPYEQCRCDVEPGVGGVLTNCVYSTEQP